MSNSRGRGGSDWPSQESHDNDSPLSLAKKLKHATQESANLHIPVIFSNLSVKVPENGPHMVKTLPRAIFNTFGYDQLSWINSLLPSSWQLNKPSRFRKILQDCHGFVNPGEMLLVLGRPGSGCSTFLRTISNQTQLQVDGSLRFAGIDAQTFASRNKTETVYLPEEDNHIKALTVRQTLEFALRTNLPRKSQSGGQLQQTVLSLAKAFGLEHCLDTNVGGPGVPGISGGERKRVSIAEVLACGASVQCFDNSTRGLDSSTALDFVKALRTLTDSGNKTTMATLYQAGESIYESFNKVIILHEGRAIFFGPSDQAKAHFEQLGFISTRGETTSEFLTSITHPDLRKTRPGSPAASLRTADDFVQSFKTSQICRSLQQDLDRAFQSAEQLDTPPSKSIKLWYPEQVYECLRREVQLVMGKRNVMYQKWINTAILCLVVGSEYFDVASSAQGAFTRESVVFYAIIINAWMQYPELFEAHTNRPVVERQSALRMYRASAVAIARILVELPFLMLQHAIFMLAFYFLSHNTVSYTAGDFFFFYFVLLLSTVNFSNMLKMFAYYVPSVEDCFRWGGIASATTAYFAGFLIPVSDMFPVWSWIHYICPPRYTYEALLSNDFKRVSILCQNDLIPSVPDADPIYQICPVRGSRPGQTIVPGLQYVESLGLHYSNRWRNVGILFAFAGAYMLVGIFGGETMRFTSQGGAPILFASKDTLPSASKMGQDVEKEAARDPNISSQGQKRLTEAPHDALAWKNLTVTIGDRLVLKGISGYVRPGDFVALCGASGAGKTTLLTHLCQINSSGVAEGHLAFNGQRLDESFRRRIGFAQQNDLHDGAATVREALEFSALLRQSAEYTHAEKMAYVDHVLQVLELAPYQHALIGDSLSGLGVELTKRVTIGVELAARPKILFADEPTSGLDAQGAASIVRYLKILAAQGQAILVTVHQPSAALFNMFDKLLALSSNGDEIYFGPVEGALEYFERHGASAGADQNPAEFILETIGAGVHGRSKDTARQWSKTWADSSEADSLQKELKVLGNLNDNSKCNDGSPGHASTFQETYLLTQRMLLNQWRRPSYVYSKIWVHTIQAILIGFTFFQLGTSIHDLQSRAFGAFALVFLVNTIVNPILGRFFANRLLWKSREGPTHAYGWTALCNASILSELPAIMLCTVIYYLLWYWLSGLPSGASAGATFLIILTYEVFEMTLGLFITAATPDLKAAGLLLVFLVTTCNWFNGVVVPYSQIQAFWRYWLYYMNPLTYLFGAMIIAANKDVAVICDPEDLYIFPPPSGQTCGQYADAWATQSKAQLLNPDSFQDCQVCPYQTGNQYLERFNLYSGQLANNLWAYWAVFMLFTFSNVIFFYILTWARHVKGWKPFYFF